MWCKKENTKQLLTTQLNTYNTTKYSQHDQIPTTQRNIPNTTKYSKHSKPQHLKLKTQPQTHNKNKYSQHNQILTTTYSQHKIKLALRAQHTTN